LLNHTVSKIKISEKVEMAGNIEKSIIYYMEKHK